MPVPQGYQCNPALDRLNATWLSHHGPERLLLQWYNVDGRHPLADNPATMLATYQWYELELQESQYLLLRRRPTPQPVRLTRLRLETLDVRKGIPILESDDPVFIRLNLALTPAGRAAKLIYRIPEILMSIGSASAGGVGYRVFAESLATPVLISHLPVSLESAADLFSGRFVQNPRNRTLTISGKGLDHYITNCEVEFLTLAAPGQPTLTSGPSPRPAL